MEEVELQLERIQSEEEAVSQQWAQALEVVEGQRRSSEEEIRIEEMLF